jgi:hypothetical protein
MKTRLQKHSDPLGKQGEQGSILLMTFGMIIILMTIIGVILMSTTNKYFTAYQWASWQEALQGAESGADIAMGEMRKDVDNTTATVPWVGWNIGTYKTQNGKKVLDPSSEKTIDSTGHFAGNNGNGNGNSTLFTLGYFTSSPGLKSNDYITYNTQLSAHAGEGNANLKIGVTLDAPSSLIAPSGAQWVRVRATGTTDLAGPVRVSEERLDNRLRKLGMFVDKVMGQSVAKPVASRRIELVAKPVSLFSGALMTMVQFKDDKGATVSDSFSSEDPTHWPLVNGTYDLTLSHDPTSPLGKNGDIASNAFPVKHDHSENLDITGDTIWGDVGNNYSQIKGLDPTYYGNSPQGYADASGVWHPYYGLDNENFGTTNPNSTLINTKSGTGDVSGNISTNFYRDLPPIVDPGWTSSTPGFDGSVTVISNKTADYTASSDPTQPSRIKVSSVTLGNKDIWAIKTAAPAKGAPAGTVVDSYIEIWVTGNIKLDDGGQIDIKPGVHATIYFDHDVKIGEGKETKTNAGGFYTESDDAKDLILLGVTQPDAGKMPKDDYLDPLGNDSLYTPYKASGNVVFKENDFTGAIYAPDHNIVFDNTKDGKGKRNKRKQDGNDFYGSYVGRTIHSKQQSNYHFDESLNDVGPGLDWGYISWFEDVDVDNR